MIDAARYDQARDRIARDGFTPDIQTKIGLVLTAAKSGNLAFQSQLQWLPNVGVAQQFILSQAARETEALTLLRVAVQWSPDPRLMLRAIQVVAPLTMAWGRILLPPGPLFSPLAAYRGLSLGHAQLARFRLSPVIPEKTDPLSPFAVALQRMEQEDNRMLQTQIRLLKNLGKDVPVAEREALIEKDQEIVCGVVNQFLDWLAE